jgi:hypothetical protein
VALDGVGNLYVTDGRVVELAAGSSTPTVLLQPPNGGAGDVAVDTAGNLYSSARTA